MPRERKEREWHNVTIFNERLAEIAEKKGSKVYLGGALQTRKWTDSSGQDRYTTEVVLNRFRGELTMLDGAGGATGPCRRSTAASTRNVAAGVSATNRQEPPLSRLVAAPPLTTSTTTSRSEDQDG